MNSLLADAFYRNAAEKPDKMAVWCDGKSKSYREMAELVSRCSHFMMSQGVRYGDAIAIPMNNSIESVALFFSAADLGVCLVPLNPTLPVKAVKVALAAGDVKHVMARKAFYQECEKQGGLDVQGRRICLDGDFPGTVPFSVLASMPGIRPVISQVINGEESLVLTMTSGSTGTPKPIDISQMNKYQRAMAHVREYAITEHDRIMAATPLYHSLAERLVILPLLIGATVVLLPRFTPRLWWNCVRDQQVSFTIAVSAQLAQVLELLEKNGEDAACSLRAVVSSSALLEQSVKERLIGRLHCEFHEMYGTSEVSTATTICFQKDMHKCKSVGRPFDEARLRILKEGLVDCKPGEIGEIAVCSRLFCKGYFNKKEMWEAALHEGYFLTGDLGYMDEEGYLYFVGRKKELIITGAVNVYPNDIDEVVEQLPQVKECAAFAFPDERLGETVALAVVPQENSVLSAHAIQLYCARNLADFQQPHQIFIVDCLPRNAMGKLQRMNIYKMIINQEITIRNGKC